MSLDRRYDIIFHQANSVLRGSSSLPSPVFPRRSHSTVTAKYIPGRIHFHLGGKLLETEYHKTVLSLIFSPGGLEIRPEIQTRTWQACGMSRIVDVRYTRFRTLWRMGDCANQEPKMEHPISLQRHSFLHNEERPIRSILRCIDERKKYKPQRYLECS